MKFLSLNDFSADQIYRVLDRSRELAEGFDSGVTTPTLAGRRIGLIVDDGGWRNTAALDLGCQLLGAHCVTCPVSLSGNEEIPDLARYLSNWFHLIAVRSPSFKNVRELAESSTVPVVNLRTWINHPCETLGDLSYINSVRGGLEDLSVGAVGPAANIINSWAEAADVLPISLTQVAPKKYWIDKDRYQHTNIACTDQLAELDGVDAIITDCWPDGIERMDVETLQVTANLLDHMKDECLFIPCPPVTRGAEVSDAAMEHEKCVVYEAKSHLLHVQNALIEYLLTQE